MVVLQTLLKGSCAVRLQPDVWQCVLKDKDLAFFGLKSLINLAQSNLPALSFAISLKCCIPIAQKKESRGANSSMSSPAFNPARTYSKPSASV